MSLQPRCVLVERATEFRELLARHGTRAQAGFFLEQRGLAIGDVEERHLRYEETRAGVVGAIPATWRTATVERTALDRFLFTEDDVVVVLGQDGLVANVAKYLSGQPVIGLDPEPARNAGVLVGHAPAAMADLCADVAAGRAAVEARTMVSASLDDGQELLALNEIFIGHRSHQSARYRLAVGGRREHQSSSGLIVSTGTGATGWASSVNRERGEPVVLPAATERALAWFVREAWVSPATGGALTEGTLGDGGGDAIEVTSEMGEDGVVFGDGIEADRLAIDWGQRVTVRVAGELLRLVR